MKRLQLIFTVAAGVLLFACSKGNQPNPSNPIPEPPIGTLFSDSICASCWFHTDTSHEYGTQSYRVNIPMHKDADTAVARVECYKAFVEKHPEYTRWVDQQFRDTFLSGNDYGEYKDCVIFLGADLCISL
jgi:hypothetical protein